MGGIQPAHGAARRGPHQGQGSRQARAGAQEGQGGRKVYEAGHENESTRSGARSGAAGPPPTGGECERVRCA
eukprot:6214634-Pleurochrysis_carterae.AAC.4